MYKIIGADGAEYGPASADQIRQWIHQRRVNAQTKIRPEPAGEWKTLGETAEFAELLANPEGSPPVLGSEPPVESRTSGLAIASLVLGIMGWVTAGITALVGLVLGIIALVKISGSRGKLRGTGLALAGTILSGVFVLMLPVLAAMLLPALSRAKSRAQSIACMNNMRQLALGGIMYAVDHKDRFPNADNWCDALGKYVANPRAYLCPVGNPNLRCHYAFNASLSGVDSKTITEPNRTVLMFEVDGGWNLSGGRELVLNRPRHWNSVGLVFADGHAESVKESGLSRLKWDP